MSRKHILRAALPLLSLLLLRVVPAGAQERLTDVVIEAAIELHNRPATIRFIGDSRITDANQVAGDLATLEGRLVIEGRVTGDVLVLNGDLELRAGSVIGGRALVIGGTFIGDRNAVAGGVQSFQRTFAYELRDGMLERVRRRTSELAAGRSFDFGRFDIVANARPGYNRVEGLPMLIGPRLTLGHSNPTILEALVTYRTAAGFELESGDVGHSLRIEQFVGGKRAIRFGARAYSEIATIEDAGINDREASLAAFVFHRDYRDHYERQGLAGYVRVDPPLQDFNVRVEYADERHYRVRARRPLSIFDNDEPWRAEPLAATGSLRRINGAIEYDTRNMANDPAHGWWLRAELERGLGGSLRDRYEGFDQPAPREFTHGILDLRRYARLGPNTRIALRAALMGSLDGEALPVQRQHALGGEGSLPGFALNQFSCGARDNFVFADEAPFQRFYGCDNSALIQVEYQSDLRFLRRLRGSVLDELGLFQKVRLALFFDAGRAWTTDSAAGVRTTGNDDFSVDGGFGLRFGPIGAYWAIPLSGRGETMNFFIRLGPRL